MSIPKKIPPKIFIFGFIIIVGCALVPFFVFLLDWYRKYDDAPPSDMIWHQLVITGGAGAALYWKKFKAQIELPPDWAAAVDLVREAKSTTTEKDSAGNIHQTKVSISETVTPTNPPAPEQ